MASPLPEKIEYIGEGFCCKNCSSKIPIVVYQQFHNGTTHHRVNCERCGSFNGYQSQDKKKSVGTKWLMFELRRKLEGQPITTELKEDIFEAVWKWWGFNEH